jgi:2-oxoglutarate dehydrogenase E2 component (dihydrolipoamide succinyltransferase)
VPTFACSIAVLARRAEDSAPYHFGSRYDRTLSYSRRLSKKLFMPVEIKVPSVGESVTEVTIDKWLFQEGDAIERDKTIAVLESEKATVELPAEVSGRVAKILKKRGETAAVGEVIAIIDTDGAPSAKSKAEQKPATPPKAPEKPAAAQPKTELPKPPPLPARAEEPAKPKSVQTPPPERAAGLQPAGEKSELPVTNRQHAEAPAKVPAAEPKPAATEEPSASVPAPQPGIAGREEEVVPMTRLRRTVARRLVEAQHNAALLTTFNEIDMSEVMTLRKQYGEAFQQKYNVKARLHVVLREGGH